MKFLVFFCLVLCISREFAIAALSDDEVTYITETCCQAGQQFAVTASTVKQCNDAKPPDDVEPEDSVICLAGLRSCCEQHFKLKDECSEGMTFSPAKRCGVPKTDTGKTCCEECTFGRLSGESQGKEGCGSPAGEYVSPTTALRKNAFYKCCIEAAEKPTTTEPPPPPTTTTTTTEKPTTTPKPREKCQPNSCDHQCHDDGDNIRCSCNEGYRLQKDNKSCKDINECAEADDDLCTAEGTVCHNIPGSFKCVPLKKRDVSLSCPPGFKRNVMNQVCDDINECQSPRPPCPKYLCENTIGGYKCAGKPGRPFEESSPGKVTEPPDVPPPEKNDICPPGFRSGPTDECLDIDECEEHGDDCQRLSQYCINTHGSFFCQDHVSKRCAPGFVVNKSTGVCQDINECEESSEVCRRSEVCVNMPGAYTCKSKISTLPQLGTSTKNCQEGTRPRPGGTGCEDIDECREGTHLCDQFQNCVNTFGAHECQCKNGFELDSSGSGSCVDINECALKLDNCRDGTYCLNVVGTYTCTRKPPTTTTTSKPEYEYEYYDSDEENSTTTPTDSNPQRQPDQRRPSVSSSNPTPVPTTPITPAPPQPTRPPYVPRTTTTQKPYTNPPRPYPTRPERPVNPENPNSRNPDTPARPDYRPNPRRPDIPESPRRVDEVSGTEWKPVDEPPVIPKRAYVTTSTTPEVLSTTPRPVYSRRPIQRRPEVTEVTVPSPTDVNTLERDKDKDGSYGIDTSDIPKDRWTNVIGKDTPDDVRCTSGYQKNAHGVCEDIDECETNQHICSAVEVCQNRNGGYICTCKPGYKKNSSGFCAPAIVQTTTSTTTAAPTPPPPPPLPPRPESGPEFTRPERPRCDPGYNYDYSRGRCTAASPPPPPSLPPRPESGPVDWPERGPERPRTSPTRCEMGYKYDHARSTCVVFCPDIDECATGRANCSPDEECVNVDGGYRCVCGRRCRQPNTDLKPTYVVPPRETPADSNVITIGAQYGQRGPRYMSPTYRRLPDSGAIVNSCPWGYKLTSERMCLDIDECAKNISECGPEQKCENFYGGYSCQCPAGHKLLATDRCTDIDECLYLKPCPFNSKCINTEGSYSCSCGDGFRNAPSNDKVCVDVDECSQTPGVCEQGCINAWGSYRCYCSKGYRLTNDSRSCEDVDECSEWASVASRGRLCGGECTNEPGSYRCSCPQGYRLAEDARSCIDIDECDSGEATCAHSDGGEVCQNTRGGYHCHRIDCPPGYRLESKHRCSRIQRSCPVGDWGCLHQPSSYSYNFISFVANMHLPDGNVDLFTMRGPAWVHAMVTFEMRMVSVQAPPGVLPVDIGCFDMRPMNNICVVSLRCSPAGPQVAELELSMSLYQRQQFAGSAVARLVVIVSQYEY